MKHRLFALCLALASVVVSAQSYPNKPIRRTSLTNSSGYGTSLSLGGR